MKTPTLFIALCLFLSSCIGTGPDSSSDSAAFKADSIFENSFYTNTQWPSYRGYYANGFLSSADLPENWNLETSENIRWRIPLPGMGLSCPVIWDDQLFITTAVSESDSEGFRTGIYGDIEPVGDSSIHQWIVYAINKNNGEIAWQKVAHSGIPMVKRHPKSTHANTSVATNGEYVVAFFGSEGLYCYDMNGELIWKRDFGLIKSAWDVYEAAEWEFSSSPVIHDGKVIIQADALNTAFVAVIDLQTGETIWRQEREEIPNWCTPNLYIHNGDMRVVVNGFRHRGGYDLESGEEIWSQSGGGDVPVPTPVIWKDLIYFNSAHGRDRPLMAVKNSASGNIAYPKNDSVHHADIAWFNNRSGPYMSSVLVYNDLLYSIRWNGNLTCQDARTGEEYYRETVDPGSFIASPVAADGKIFLVQEEGDVYVVKAGKEYELLGKSSIGGISLVTPGISANSIFFRTENELIAVSKEQ